MPTSRLRMDRTLSSYVSQNKPTTNYFKASMMKARNFSQKGVRTYVWLPLSFMPGKKYDSYVLNMREFLSTIATGNRTVTIRRVTTDWNWQSVTWNKRPSTSTSNQVSVTKTTRVPGGVWSFDITGIVNDALSVGNFYGVEITVENNVDDAISFFSDMGPSGYRPWVDAQYSYAPMAPQGLNPAGGRAVSLAKPVLSWDYKTQNANINMNAFQVQMSSTNSFSGTLLYDSGTVVNSVSQLNLAGTVFAGLADDQVAFWRVRVRDTDNNWSAWSSSTQFQRQVKGTVVITNPPVAPNNVITDPRPEIRWTVSGATQRQFEVVLTKLGGTVLHTSGRITNPEGAYLLPDGLISTFAEEYTVQVRVFDDYDRAATIGDTAWIEDKRTFQFDPSFEVDPVTNLTATKDPVGRPWVILEWDWAGDPTAFLIAEGDTILRSNIDPDDILVSGSHYRYVYRGVSPRTPHTYTVLAQQGSVVSADNPSASVTVRPITAWLCSDDGEDAVPLTNYSNGLSLVEDSASYTVFNATESTIIYGGLRGFEGSFGGEVTNAVGTKTSAEYLAQLIDIRLRKGSPMWLSFADQMVFCVIRNFTYAPKVYNEEITYVASFEVVSKGIGS